MGTVLTFPINDFTQWSPPTLTLTVNTAITVNILLDRVDKLLAQHPFNTCHAAKSTT